MRDILELQPSVDGLADGGGGDTLPLKFPSEADLDAIILSSMDARRARKAEMAITHQRPPEDANLLLPPGITPVSRSHPELHA